MVDADSGDFRNPQVVRLRISEAASQRMQDAAADAYDAAALAVRDGVKACILRPRTCLIDRPGCVKDQPLLGLDVAQRIMPAAMLLGRDRLLFVSQWISSHMGSESKVDEIVPRIPVQMSRDGEVSSERKPTILDVAKRAKVAVGTVSRVINGQPNVSEDKRKRVHAAVAEVGYVPDFVARSMRSNRTMVFAAVMRDFTVPVLSMFVDSMQKEIDSFGYSLIVASSYHDLRREVALLKGFQQRRIDGLVIATSSETDPLLLEALAQVDFPLVLIDRELPANIDTVSVNHASGTQQAVSYLVDIGHRRIAMISGELNVHATQSRLDGFREGIRMRGLPYQPDMVRLASFGADAGYAEARRLLECDQRPTAILAGGSALLPGVIRAARDLGVSIPGDLSVIAGADSDVAQLASPPFTVVRWSHDVLGKAAARFLMARLDKPSLPRQRLTVDAELVLRGSCVAPRF